MKHMIALLFLYWIASQISACALQRESEKVNSASAEPAASHEERAATAGKKSTGSSYWNSVDRY